MTNVNQNYLYLIQIHLQNKPRSSWFRALRKIVPYAMKRNAYGPACISEQEDSTRQNATSALLSFVTFGLFLLRPNSEIPKIVIAV